MRDYDDDYFAARAEARREAREAHAEAEYDHAKAMMTDAQLTRWQAAGCSAYALREIMAENARRAGHERL